ncbi:MAG: hypothetical protein M3O91_00885, partial [Chloroflexota bacterium]|nr:hypothetical protein [Chloroflexota bacterium]
RMQRADERSEALAAALGEGRVGPIGRDAASRAVLDALDDDLDTPNAIRVLERGARGAKEERTRASLALSRRCLASRASPQRPSRGPAGSRTLLVGHYSSARPPGRKRPSSRELESPSGR